MWKSAKLGDVCNIINGSTPSRKELRYWENGNILWFTIDDLRAQGREITTTAQKITAAAVNETSVKLVPANSVLLCCTASVGEVAIARSEMATNQQFNALVSKTDNLLPEYLYYFASTLKETLLAVSGSATINFVAISKLKNISILVPPLAEQKRIVAKLDAAFAEIDEALLCVNHKRILAEQLVSRTISSVFSQIDDNELKHTTLGEVTYTAGRIGWKGLTKKEYVEEGRLFLSVHGLNYGKFVDFRDAFRITQARYDESPEIMLKEGDILLCKDGAGIGKLGVIGKLPEPATINSSLLLIRPSEQLTTDYIYYSLLSSEFQSVIQSKIDGATTPHLYQRDINQFQFSFPSLQIQMEITEKISLALLSIKKLQNSFATNIKNYETLKKALLAQELQSEAA